MAGSESLFGSDNLPNIAWVEPTAGLARANPPDGGFYRRLPIARCVSVCRKIRPPETSTPSAKAGMGSTPKSSNLKIKNAMAKKIKGRPRSADPCRYHYNFKLNEAQNKRFLDMLERSGCTDNKSRFILSRLFG